MILTDWNRGIKTLTLRIYVTVVAALLLFALVSGWLFQLQMEHERSRAESMLSDRMAVWRDLIQRSLPGDDAAVADQAAALREWSQRLRLPLALDSAQGERIVESESFTRRALEGTGHGIATRLEDGRTLWMMRPRMMRPPGDRIVQSLGPDRGPGFGVGGMPPGGPIPLLPPAWQRGLGLVVLLVLLFIAVAAGAWPVARRLTRRLQALKSGVEQFGAGALHHRVELGGSDEVAALAASFNQAAGRIEALVRSHQSLLANASHELRSPLARMKMAVSMLEDAPPAQREQLKREIDTNVAELDALVEEVLLSSRLDAKQDVVQREPVDLLALAAEEGARVDASVDGPPSCSVTGEERLLRRALRNLLENARRYGGSDVSVRIEPGPGRVDLHVCDRGPGVPEALRERIFEAFYRLPGHAEKAGGVGLGLNLVKQIAERHQGSVHCEAREGGGSCFVLSLPA